MGLQGLGFAYIEWNPNGPAPKSFSWVGLGLDGKPWSQSKFKSNKSKMK